LKKKFAAHQEGRKFDAAETGLGRGGEAVEKLDLVEQHRQIRGKFRHRPVSLTGSRQSFTLAPDL
jgi:hypothetical protein